MLLRIGDHEPQLGEGAWVAPTATLIGQVSLGAGASAWYGVVVRGDTTSIRIGARTNLQDNVVCHADPHAPLSVGDDVTVGHAAVLHGCTVEDGCLIGMGATVLNGALVGAGSLVAANALVTEGMVVPPGSLVAGVPAKVRRPLTDAESGALPGSATTYERLRDVHRGAAPRPAPPSASGQ